MRVARAMEGTEDAEPDKTLAVKMARGERTRAWTRQGLMQTVILRQLQLIGCRVPCQAAPVRLRRMQGTQAVVMAQMRRATQAARVTHATVEVKAVLAGGDGAAGSGLRRPPAVGTTSSRAPCYTVWVAPSGRWARHDC